MKDDLADCIVYASKLMELDTVDYTYVKVQLTKHDISFSAYIAYADGFIHQHSVPNAKALLNHLILRYNDELKSIIAQKSITYGYA